MYFVPKVSQTYAETLEAVGLAYMFEKMGIKTTISDKGGYFQIDCEREVEVTNQEFFHFYKYLKTTKSSKDFEYHFDYEAQKEARKRNEERRKKKLDKELFENIDENYSIYSILYVQQSITAYNSIFETLEKDFKENFPELLKSILLKYSTFEERKEKLGSFTAGQIVSPILGKGLNKGKASGIGGTNLKTDFISQLLRFSGLFHSAIFKFMGDDTKAYVLQPHQIEFQHLKTVRNGVQKTLFAKELIKLDIKSILLTTTYLLEKHEKNRRKRRFAPKDKISGLQTVFFQKLGQTRTVTNISFLELPHFIEISSEEDAKSWLRFINEDLLNSKKDFIGFIGENEHSIFSNFRAFLTESDFNYFFEFSFLYFAYAMRELINGKHPQFFSEKNLKEVLLKKFSTILENSGFQAVAKAIRNSTISLQFSKSRTYETKYGVAQDLKRKSEDREELLQYISEFIASYNSETARKVELGKVSPENRTQRAVIKSEEIEEFVKILDEHNPKTVAGLLASYGISIRKKDEN